MTLLTDLEEFVRDHRPHGTLPCDAAEPVWNGYRLTVSCACGVVFERWVTSLPVPAILITVVLAGTREEQ